MAATADTAAPALRKNSAEDLILTWSEFQNVRYLDVRVWAATERGPVATKKGLTLSPGLWRQLLPLIEKELTEYGN